MTDRELLELAAKAAGIEFSEIGGGARYAPQPGIMQPYVPWNPLTDDGDALRLAVKLEITIMFDSYSVWCGHHGAVKHHNGDPCAATRLVIVRAAAEIGKRMK